MGDVGSIVITSAVGAVVQLVVGTLFYVAIRRHVDRVDRLEMVVDEMKEKRLSKIDAELTKAANSRKSLYEDVREVRTHFVHKKECERAHRELMEQQHEFRAAVIDLARVQEKSEMLAKQIHETSERVVAVTSDIARLEGRHDA